MADDLIAAVGRVKQQIQTLRASIETEEQKRDTLRFAPMPDADLRKMVVDQLDEAFAEAKDKVRERLVMRLERVRRFGLPMRRHTDAGGNPVGTERIHGEKVGNPLEDVESFNNLALLAMRDTLESVVLSIVDEGPEWSEEAGPAMKSRAAQLKKVESRLEQLRGELAGVEGELSQALEARS